MNGVKQGQRRAATVLGEKEQTIATLRARLDDIQHARRDAQITGDRETDNELLTEAKRIIAEIEVLEGDRRLLTEAAQDEANAATAHAVRRAVHQTRERFEDAIEAVTRADQKLTEAVHELALARDRLSSTPIRRALSGPISALDAAALPRRLAEMVARRCAALGLVPRQALATDIGPLGPQIERLTAGYLKLAAQYVPAGPDNEPPSAA